MSLTTKLFYFPPENFVVLHYTFPPTSRTMWYPTPFPFALQMHETFYLMMSQPFNAIHERDEAGGDRKIATGTNWRVAAKRS